MRARVATAVRSFHLRAGDSTTEVVVGPGALDGLGRALSSIAQGRWVIISSPPVFARHGSLLRDVTSRADIDPRPVLVPDGEAAKSWTSLGRLLETLASRGLRRDGGLVALGGGSVGDVAGLAASLVLRGVPVVQVPTTLLAASDSALGGKTAVNLHAGKNLAGTVHHPALVAVDPRLLVSLSDRELRSGLAEVVKSSMLDRSFDRVFPRLASGLLHRESAALGEAAFRSLRMKARVVEKDPLERTGARFALNLGHTLGHALEAASHSPGRHGFRSRPAALTHGEAVGWGLLAALKLSVREAGLSRRVADRLAGRVASLVRPPVPTSRTLKGSASLLAADKKADRQGLRVVLLSAPGSVTVRRVPERDLISCLDEVLAGYNARGGP